MEAEEIRTRSLYAYLAVRVCLTLLILRLPSSKAQEQLSFENHLNQVLLVFIEKLSSSTFRWLPMWQGFSHFSTFLVRNTLMYNVFLFNVITFYVYLFRCLVFHFCFVLMSIYENLYTCYFVHLVQSIKHTIQYN